MIRKFSVFLLFGVIIALSLSSWATVVAQESSSQKQPQPQPVSIAFDPTTDTVTYRPSNLEQSHEPSRAVIHEDDREPVLVQKFPWSAVGRLDVIKQGEESHLCTGTLIGKNLVLTNSHCLFEEDKLIVSRGSDQNDDIRIVFKPNLMEGFFVEPDLATVVDYIYGWETSYKPSDDWAILKLDKDLGNKYGYLGWRVLDLSNQNTLDEIKKKVILAGYSGDYPNEEERGFPSNISGEAGETAGVHRGCSIEGIIATSGKLAHNCDTMPGASGSAIMALFDDENYYIIGLHSAFRPLYMLGNASGLSLPLSPEKCIAFDGREIEGGCVNVGVQVAKWSVQATEMRSE